MSADDVKDEGMPMSPRRLCRAKSTVPASDENSVSHTQESIPNWQAVLVYVAEAGRKLGKSKLYTDISRGRLRKQPDGTFRVRDVDRYLVSLPTAGTPEGFAEKAEDRQRRKEEADIRKAEAAAKREEFDLAVRQGKFLPREDIAVELAARAVALRDALKTAFETKSVDIIDAVSGDAQLSTAFLEVAGRIVDETLSHFARPITIELDISGIAHTPDDAEEEET